MKRIWCWLFHPRVSLPFCCTVSQRGSHRCQTEYLPAGSVIPTFPYCTICEEQR
jgi:hypothetical protein